MPWLQRMDPDTWTVAGIWEITEPVSYFLRRLDLTAPEMAELQMIRNEQKQKQWLAARYALHLLTGSAVRLPLIKDVYGKPGFTGSDLELSISHSDRFAAAMVSNRPCGVDVQRLNPRLLKVTKRIVAAKTLLTIPGDQNLLFHGLYWCATEAVLKAFGNKSLQLDQDICFDPFKTIPEGFMSLAQVTFGGVYNTYALSGKSLDDMLIVTALKS